MSYWTKRRKVNASVEQQIAELSKVSSDANTYHTDNAFLPPLPVDVPAAAPVGCFHNSGSSDIDVNNIELVNDAFGTDNETYSDDGSDHERDWYCDNDEASESGTINDDIVDELSQWYCKNRITVNAMSELLNILRPRHPELPKDPRTLMKTVRGIDIEKNVQVVSNGTYYHFGISAQVFPQMQHQENIQVVKDAGEVTIQLNVDGVPLYKSTNGQFWPILGRIDRPFVGEPFVIGIFYGVSKPINLDFLIDFCTEYTMLRQSGIRLDDIVVSFSLSCLICDAPARAFLKCIKGHTSYSACERCSVCGIWSGKMTFPDLNAPLRSDRSFSKMIDTEHHRGISPLSSESLGIGMVSNFCLDYMHLICLGVVRRLLWLWFCGPLKLNCRLSARQTTELSDVLVNMKSYIPKEFARKPRSLFQWQRFKATEFRQLLLYTGVVAFAGKLSDAVYKNFLLLSVGVYLLLNESSDTDFINYAEELLIAFVKHYSDLYGSDMVVYNVHNVIHLADDARKYGSLDKVSAFCFENYLGKLVNLVNKPSQPLQQVVRRLLERREFLVHEGTRNGMGDITPGDEHHSGPVPSGIGLCRQFNRITMNGVRISSSIGNNCIVIGNDIAVVRNILKKDSNIFFVYQKFLLRQNFYTYPLESSEIGIYQVSQLSSDLFVGSLCNFKKKNVMLPFKDTFVVIPLLNL
jgi:hypothetical protein